MPENPTLSLVSLTKLGSNPTALFPMSATFFGELDWVKAPERVGRDVRYQNQRMPSWSGSEKSGRKTPMKMSGGIASSAVKNTGLGMSLGRFG